MKIMKRLMTAMALSFGLISCGGANDGNPNTDTTTTMPVDTAVMNSNAGDTATQINTNTGTYSTDTGNNKKTDVRSSSSAYPDGQGKKTSKDSARQ